MTTASDALVVGTRFGDRAVPRHRRVELLTGLIGLGDSRSFVLLDPPRGDGRRLMFLQSVDEPAVGLWVLPLSAEASGFDEADLAAATRRLNAGARDLMVLLAVTVGRAGTALDLTVNLRAPIVLDAARRVGLQHVIENDKYPLRRRLC